MYFDAVLDDRMNPVFNGTPDEVENWLTDSIERWPEFQVCIGRNMQLVTPEEYLNA